MPRRSAPSEIRSIYDKGESPAPKETPIPKLAEEVLQKPKGVITAASLKGGPVELPTGIIVEIQRAGVLSLAAAGHIPNSLLGVAARAAKAADVTITEDYPDLTPDERTEKQAQDRVDMEGLVNAVVCAVVVNPRVVAAEDEEQEDSVWVGRLHPMDKTAIYYYSQYPQSQWDRFRSIA